MSPKARNTPARNRLLRLKKRIHQETLQVDRLQLLRRANNLLKTIGSREPTRKQAMGIDNLQESVDRSVSRVANRRKNFPPSRFPSELPITAHRTEIVEAIRKHPVIIVAGETGSGKSTQLPKLCLTAGRGVRGLIASTQPRRIAAVNIARRIAEEMGQPLGQAVGYKVRFADETGPDNYIQVMTDGLLLSETQSDRKLWRYDTIIIDEAHERSLNIDFLIGYIKRLQKQRHNLKLIITSATIDIEKFQKAFDQAPVIEVSGRLYPVDIQYWVDDENDKSEENGYVEMAVAAVSRICQSTPSGDILVFMPGEQDIRETIQDLTGRFSKQALILPLFARLPANQQQRIFKGASKRKIIVSTNVAETSLTIPGIKYVVDSGLARIARYSARTRTKSLTISPISRASADQRAGRCGRTADGICIRLFSQAAFDQRPPFTAPEIRRSNLAEVILRMLALKLGGPEQFDFVDPPDTRSIQDGHRLLTELGAIIPGTSGAQLRLTPMGRQMAGLPVGPRTARMLIEAQKRGCLADVLVIAAALGIADPRERPFEATQKADRQHRQFNDPLSDFVALLNIWKKFKALPGGGKFAAPLRSMCREDYLSFRRMREWADIHGQLQGMIRESAIKSVKTQAPQLPPKPTPKTSRSLFSDRYQAIHTAILSGFLANVALQKEKNIYNATRNREVMIFPGSGLFNGGGKWIVAAEIMETKRLYARWAATIDNRWITEVGPKVCRYTYLDPHWEKSRGKVVATEQVSLMGLIVGADRKVPYGPIDPEEAAALFIAQALVPGALKGRWPFLDHNLQLAERGRDMEDRLRRRDLVAEEAAQIAFYQERLSEGVYDIATFKQAVAKGDHFLRMTEKDLFRYEPQSDWTQHFPNDVKIGRMRVKCDYAFQPGDRKDGLTIRVPLPMASQLNAQSLQWLVPGMLEEKVVALIKLLPKSLRKPLLPVNGTLRLILPDLQNTSRNQSFGQALSRIIRDKTGLHIPPGTWPVDQLPEHLKTRIALTDAKDTVVTADRDLAALHKTAPAKDAPCPEKLWRSAREKHEQTELRGWPSIGDLPSQIQIPSSGSFQWPAYPALTKRGDLSAMLPVDLVLYASAPKANRQHLLGVAALTALGLSSDIRYLKKSLALPDLGRISQPHWQGPGEIKRAVLEGFLRQYLAADIGTQTAFEDHLSALGTQFLPLGRDYLQKTGLLLATVAKTSQVIEKIRLRVMGQPSLFQFTETMSQSLWNLVPANFSALYPVKQLGHVGRYVQALEIRLQRGIENLDKDHQKTTDVTPFDSFLKSQARAMGPDTSPAKRCAVEDFFWLLEEFKVSVYAQELKTARKVSAKRLQKAMQNITDLV